MTLISLFMGQLNDRLHNNLITGMSCTCLPASVIATQGGFRQHMIKAGSGIASNVKCLDQEGARPVAPWAGPQKWGWSRRWGRWY